MDILDRNRKPLDVGDKVIFTRYNSHWLYEGEIVSISPKDIYLVDKHDGKCKMSLDYSTTRILKK